MDVRFTDHADEKFGVLARHGVHIVHQQVIETITTPDVIDYNRAPLRIAQTSLDETHVLRVVYRVEGTVLVVITFYPGRKSQYEKE